MALPKKNIARRLEVDFDHVYVAFDSQNHRTLRLMAKNIIVLKNTENSYVVSRNNLVSNGIKHVEE